MLRTPLRRFIAIGLGLTLLGAMGYLGLGWAVWSHPSWIGKALGADREFRLRIAYTNAVGALLPGDRDRDGVSDGVEYLWKTDPRNASDHFQFQFWTDGFSGVHAPDSPSRTGRDISNSLLPRFGKRLLVRGFVEFFAVEFPKDFSVRITPPPGGRLALPGMAQAPGDLEVPVARDGSVAFDMDLRADIFADRNTDLSVTISNAATGEKLGKCSVYGVHALPPLSATMEKMTRAESRLFPEAMKINSGIETVPSGIFDGPRETYQVRWPGIPRPAEEVVVEVALDIPGAEWHPVGIFPAAARSCVISHHPGDGNRFHRRPRGTLTGPLKCRVVPIRSTGLFKQSPPSE